LPQGSRLIGSYDSVVAYGQKRALLVWQRIILPDGSSVRIDNVPARMPPAMQDWLTRSISIAGS
jgi:type IV secretion system protein VirB10